MLKSLVGRLANYVLEGLSMRALRTLSRQWQLTAVATFSLAIAMALGIIGLSAANTMLLLPLAAPDPGRLVAIYSRGADDGVDQISYPDLEYYRANNHVFTGIAASPNSISLSIDRTNDGREIRIIGRPVSANYFDVLGIRPLRGRFFNAVDDRVNSHVAVMTYACWRRLGFDANIVGKSVAGNTIVGVTPPSFTGSLYGLNGDLLYPLAQLDDPASFEKRDARRFFLIGRLKPGVSRRQAQAEITMLARQLAEAYPHADKGRTAVLTRASLLPPDALAGAQWVSAIVMALILLVLLIACANVANLLLAAAVGRRQEAAIKLALGAPRGRLIRDFLQESGLLCAAGGLFGFAVASAVVARFNEFTYVFPMYGPYSVGLNLHLDATVAGLTVGLVLLATVATGLAPALYASSPRLAQMLAGEIVAGGGAKSRWRKALVSCRSRSARSSSPAWGSACAISTTCAAPISASPPETSLAIPSTCRPRALTRSAARPSTRRSAARPPPSPASNPSPSPPICRCWVSTKCPSSGPNPSRRPRSRAPSSIPDISGHCGCNCLRAATSPPRIGRAPRRRHHQSQNGGHVLARRRPHRQGVVAGAPPRRFTVVGVAADAKYDNIDEAPRPFLYLPLAQNYSQGINVIVRTTGDPRATIEPLNQAVRGSGHQHFRPARDVRRLDQPYALPAARRRRVRRRAERTWHGAGDGRPLRRRLLLRERAEEGTRHPCRARRRAGPPSAPGPG